MILNVMFTLLNCQLHTSLLKRFWNVFTVILLSSSVVKFIVKSRFTDNHNLVKYVL